MALVHPAPAGLTMIPCRSPHREDAMEHRWNARRPVTGEAVIECPRLGKVRAAIRDVSMGGMCVEASTTLPLNAPVMVEFHLPTRERDGGYHLRAMIVRRAGSGEAGLMFLDLGTGTVESLRNDLRAL